MSLDAAVLERLRADTPGAASVVHLNNAGSALPPQRVLDVVVSHLRREAEVGGYEAQAEVDADLERGYDDLAAMVGTSRERVAVTDSATRAWHLALHGYPFSRGDRVLLSRQEYASNAISLLQLRERHDLELVLVEDDATGQVSLEHLEVELARGAALLSLVHVPTSGGTVNPAEEAGRLCREHGTFFVLDACQSAGQLPLDLATIGCDVLSATGRKYLRAPRGTGFLALGDRAAEVLRTPVLDLHSATWVDDDHYEVRPDARRFETWERSVAGVLGLGEAVRYYAEVGHDAAWDRVRALAASLRERLEAVPGVEVHDRGQVLGGIVTFTVEGRDADEVSATLRTRGVNTSVSRGASARLDLGARDLEAVVRASVHYYNSEADLDALVEAL